MLTPFDGYSFPPGGALVLGGSGVDWVAWATLQSSGKLRCFCAPLTPDLFLA